MDVVPVEQMTQTSNMITGDHRWCSWLQVATGPLVVTGVTDINPDHHGCGLCQDHGSWPLAAVKAWTSAWPGSLPPSLLQACLSPQHMNYSASLFLISPQYILTYHNGAWWQALGIVCLISARPRQLSWVTTVADLMPYSVRI